VTRAGHVVTPSGRKPQPAPKTFEARQSRPWHDRIVTEIPEAWVELPSRELLAQFGVADHHGFIPSMYRLIGAHPRIATRMAALTEEVMRGPSLLSVTEREMLAAVTAAAQDCFY
jgi:hypothetical protein